jgi:hypothetical protein
MSEHGHLIRDARYFAKSYEDGGEADPCLATADLFTKLADALDSRPTVDEVLAEIERINEAIGPSVCLDDLKAWIKSRQGGRCE